MPPIFLSPARRKSFLANWLQDDAVRGHHSVDDFKVQATGLGRDANFAVAVPAWTDVARNCHRSIPIVQPEFSLHTQRQVVSQFVVSQDYVQPTSTVERGIAFDATSCRDRSCVRRYIDRPQRFDKLIAISGMYRMNPREDWQNDFPHWFRDVSVTRTLPQPLKAGS